MVDTSNVTVGQEMQWSVGGGGCVSKDGIGHSHLNEQTFTVPKSNIEILSHCCNDKLHFLFCEQKTTVYVSQSCAKY